MSSSASKIPFDPTDISHLVAVFRTKYEHEKAQIGHFNLAIFGKTGVGKSTLVNAIFGLDLARTGIGRPITLDTQYYEGHDGHLGVFDTRGIEVGENEKSIIDGLLKYLGKTATVPIEQQIHVAWYCIRATDLRFEETEEHFITALAETGIPVILVFTQVPMRNGRIHPKVAEFQAYLASRILPVSKRIPFLTMAVADEFNDYPKHGLHELLDETFRVAPEGVRRALAVTQQIDLKRKRDAARKFIAGAAAAATAAGATPIPFSDAAILAPIQIGMMAKIAATYGISLNKAALGTVGAVAAATVGGRSAVAGLFRLIPGVGTIIGGVITAGVAGTFTTAMGQAWLRVCEQVLAGKSSGELSEIDPEVLKALFKQELKLTKSETKQITASAAE